MQWRLQWPRMQKYLKVAIIFIYSPLLLGARLTPNRNGEKQIIWYFADWIKVVKIELCLMNADQMSIYFRFIKRKSSSPQIERCEVVWSPNLGLLIAFISDEMNVGRNLIFRKGWLMYSLSKVEKFEVGGLNLELDCTVHTCYLD